MSLRSISAARARGEYPCSSATLASAPCLRAISRRPLLPDSTARIRKTVPAGI